jgi:SPP1 gp7 family putative phage head morphogenesis protein
LTTHRPQPWLRSQPVTCKGLRVQPLAAPRPIMAMDKVGPQSAFIRARKAEAGYARQLRKLAKHVGDIVEAMWAPDRPEVADQIRAVLDRYAQAVRPWAEAVGSRMVAEVAARDRSAWRRTGAAMGRQLAWEIDNAPVGSVLQQRMAEQVELITSLPRDAAERVHRLTLEGITGGRRASDIATEILRSGEVTRSRANLIARTEVGRTSTELTKARAESIGSTHYIWRTAEDADVRPSHRRMNGRVVEWARPPTLDGMAGHAGALPNCRCYPEPVVPEV